MSPASMELNHRIIVASAGAGKTHTLTETLIQKVHGYYKKTGRFPHVATSTFTRKATRELKERLLYKALQHKDENLTHYISHSPRLQISTLHGLLHQFLKKEGYRVLSPGFSLLTETEKSHLFYSLLKQVLFNKKYVFLLKHYSFKELCQITQKYIMHLQKQIITKPEVYCYLSPSGLKDKVFHNAKNLLNTDRDLLVPSVGSEDLKTAWQEEIKKTKNQKTGDSLKEQQNQYLNLFKELNSTFQSFGREVLKAWIKAKTRQALIDYDDLEFLSLEILKSAPGLKSGWDFWFLDEYQDISLIQRQILKHLTKNSFVFIVGDPQQSIYRFRGADEEVFSKTLKEAEAKKTTRTEKKQTNFRSHPALITFFNDVFKNHFEKMTPPALPTKSALPAEAGIQNHPRNQEVAHIALFQTEKTPDRSIQYQEAFERIHTLLSQGVKPENIAILARKNKILTELALFLKNKGLAVYKHAAGSFLKKRETKDSLFLLKFLINPHDDKNLTGLLRTPYWRLSDQQILNGMQNKEGKSLWSFLLKNPTTRLKTLNDYLRLSQTHGLAFSFKKAVLDSGIVDLSRYQDPTGLREANLWKLINQVIKAQNHLPAFLLRARHAQEYFKPREDTGGEVQEAVSAISSSSLQMMTVHKAKGLEFDHVILMDVYSPLNQSKGTEEFFAGEKHTGKWALSLRPRNDEKRITSPFQKQIFKKEDVCLKKEMDRLFYVALTRARQSVSLIGSKKLSHKTATWIEAFDFFKNQKPGRHITKHYSYVVKNTLQEDMPPYPSHEDTKKDFPPKPLSPRPTAPEGIPETKNFTPPTADFNPTPPNSKTQKNNRVLNFSVQEVLSSDKKPVSHPVHLKNQISSGLKGKKTHHFMEHVSCFFQKNTAPDTQEGGFTHLLQNQDPFLKEQKDLLSHLQTIKNIPLQRLLTKGEAEWSFRWEVKSHCFLNGRIDLWGKIANQNGSDSLWVVDYKTGSAKNREQDFKQLNFYALVLHKLHALPVRQALLYLSEKKHFVKEAGMKDLKTCHNQILSYLQNQNHPPTKL